VAAHTAEFGLPADEPSAKGHFPGNPIVPGAVLLREVVRIVSAGSDAICREIRSARFLHPVRPGDRLAIVWEEKVPGEINFTCSTGDAERVVVGVLSMRAR
jgi:3-hydroxymyristoyl/3-hydroxydecanoyl-(acyl carrier protein) dehydratase